MNFINEYALLFAVALPVAVVVGIQVMLFLAGERGTLLIPGFNRYPEIKLSATAETFARGPVVVETSAATTSVVSSNDETERIAA